VVAWLSAASPAEPGLAPEVKALVGRMQGFYEATRDFKASFKQQYTYKAFNRTQVSSGTVEFKKPGMMRWDYLEPAPRTFVLSGDTAYALDPEAQTITKSSVATSQLSASVTFLWGKGRLADEFQIVKTPCPKCHGTLLTLTPLKPDARFQEIRLEVDPKTAQVLQSTVVDPDGSENVITFTDLKRNVGLTQDSFKLKPPEGTQVIDLSQPQGTH
jgi:outer membrane lipoprotein carrier protein